MKSACLNLPFQPGWSVPLWGTAPKCKNRRDSASLWATCQTKCSGTGIPRSQYFCKSCPKVPPLQYLQFMWSDIGNGTRYGISWREREGSYWKYRVYQSLLVGHRCHPTSSLKCIVSNLPTLKGRGNLLSAWGHVDIRSSSGSSLTYLLGDRLFWTYNSPVPTDCTKNILCVKDLMYRKSFSTIFQFCIHSSGAVEPNGRSTP